MSAGVHPEGRHTPVILPQGRGEPQTEARTVKHIYMKQTEIIRSKIFWVKNIKMAILILILVFSLSGSTDRGAGQII